MDPTMLAGRALDALALGVVIVDRRQAGDPVVFVNPAFERLTGYPRDAVIGRSCRFLQGEETDPVTVACIRAALAADEPFLGELVTYRADGTPFANLLSLAPLRDATGVVTHTVGVLTDVTEQRLLEQALAHPQRIETIGRLVGGVAHDFNNVLLAVNGYAELALAGLAGSPVAEDVREIQTAARRGRELTQQLAALARPEPAVDGGVEPNGVADDVLRLVRPRLGGIELDRELRASGVVAIRRTHLEQVLLNLVVNAVEAMEGQGSLSVASSDADGGVRLVVADSGPGVPEEVRDALFAPFVTTKEGGTGLGLFTVHGLVTRAGGTIELEERPAGAAFAITLPR